MIINVNYQFQEVSRTRCFLINADGNLSPVDCPSFEPPKLEQHINPLLFGLGDTVAAVTTAAGIKPCGACKKRQAALNKATPGWLSRILLQTSRVVDRLKACVWRR
jgi:hypothetical protein